MSRSYGLGRVFRYQNKGRWWIAYHHQGKEFRELSGSTNRDDAIELLQ
jgi:hypothetical protein